MNPPPILTIDNVQDSRLHPYRDLRHREPNEGFIAEGPLVVSRLLQSDYSLRSILIHAGQENKYLSQVPHDVPVYVIDREIGADIAGYDFHRGVLAHGVCRDRQSLESLVARTPRVSLGLIGISDPENVGGLLRSAAALGIHDIVIGPRTISPYARRVIRVSMASVFRHRFYDLTNPRTDIEYLQQRGSVCVATTLDKDAVPVNHLRARVGDQPIVLFVGNEADGLDESTLDTCIVQATLPMSPGVDSLNVSVAGAIFLHELVR